MANGTAQQDPTQAAFDQSAQVPDIPASAKEKGFGLLKGLTVGSGTKQEPSQLEQAIEKHHQQRLDEARMHKKNAATAAGILTYGIDPKTGQPLTDEDKQRYMNEYQAAMGHYEKTAGVNKETKGAIARARQIVEHMIHRGQQKQQGAAGGPPPVPGGAQSAPGTPPIVPSPNAGPQGSGPPQIPFADQAPFLREQVSSQIGDRRELSMYKGKSDIDQQREIAVEQSRVRATPEKYEFKVVDDKDSPGSQKIVAVDKTDPTKPYIEVKSASGEKAKPGAKPSANEGKLEIVAGMPTGRVMHHGAFVAPNEKGYTKEDENALNLAMSAQGLSEKQKERLASIRGSAYANAAAHFKFTNVVDKDTGETGEVSAIDMARNPGKYSGASEQEKIAARDAVHESLKVNFDALDKSLDRLPNGLDTQTQAIVKLGLKNEDTGVLTQLLVNKVKENASPDVINYLTNIKAMQEDVMTLRSVGGITGNSDTLRAAMVNLVPGSSTSSVMEAKMQIAAARRTSEALFGGRPKGKIGPDRKNSPGPPPPVPGSNEIVIDLTKPRK